MWYIIIESRKKIFISLPTAVNEAQGQIGGGGVQGVRTPPFLPARASEQGNVIGSVRIYICVYKKKL